MARFFFSIRSGQRLIPDREGIELPVGADLEACAAYLARRLRDDLAMPGSELEALTVEVTDASGSLVETVALDGV